MLSLQSFDKVLVEYKRKPSKLVAYIEFPEDSSPIPRMQLVKGAIQGIVVSIGPNIIGWALCDKKDVFNYEYGLDLALRRAVIAKDLSFRNRQRFYKKIPYTLQEMCVKMDDRSERYFTLPEEV